MSVDVLCPLCKYYSIYPFCALGGSGVMCMLMVDDSIYQGLSRVGNLRTIVHMGEVLSFATLDQCPNLPNGEEANSQHEPSCDEIILVSGAWRFYVEGKRVGVRWRARNVLFNVHKYYFETPQANIRSDLRRDRF